ncbi:hypothetical protein GDO78_017485 [Eleutherodactylus coqui]|uniref:Uncharacterized protein n=1 Tax=Eleutherodactylus coqui TaxID=57060 RepID=A0A8J6BAF5_ELECQ|nr:hypothetical protein GDO78_017485 [Eleutherodactylus coqui]
MIFCSLRAFSGRRGRTRSSCAGTCCAKPNHEKRSTTPTWPFGCHQQDLEENLPGSTIHRIRPPGAPARPHVTTRPLVGYQATPGVTCHSPRPASRNSRPAARHHPAPG